jgi:hypothetical protein
VLTLGQSHSEAVEADEVVVEADMEMPTVHLTRRRTMTSQLRPKLRPTAGPVKSSNPTMLKPRQLEETEDGVRLQRLLTALKPEPEVGARMLLLRRTTEVGVQLLLPRQASPKPEAGVRMPLQSRQARPTTSPPLVDSQMPQHPKRLSPLLSRVTLDGRRRSRSQFLLSSQS